MNSFDDAVSLVRHLRAEGVSFWPEGDNIRIRPAGFLAAEDRELLKAHKPAVVAWLKYYAMETCPSDDELRKRGWLNPGDRP